MLISEIMFLVWHGFWFFLQNRRFFVKIRFASRSWLQPPSAAQQCPSAQNVYYPGANIAQLLAQCRTWFQKEFEISSFDVLPHVFLCQMFAFGSQIYRDSNLSSRRFVKLNFRSKEMPRKRETQGANEAHDSGHIRSYVAWRLCGRLFCAKGNSAC